MTRKQVAGDSDKEKYLSSLIFRWSTASKRKICASIKNKINEEGDYVYNDYYGIKASNVVAVIDEYINNKGWL